MSMYVGGRSNLYTNGELLKEITLSKSQNSLTSNAKKILKDLADNIIKSYSNSGTNLPITAYNDALNYMYSSFDKFDMSMSKGSPFTYFSIVFKNSLLVSVFRNRNRKRVRKQKIKELFK